MDTHILKQKVEECLQSVYDPEIPVNIYELGLIYDIAIKEDATVGVTMTLTTPNCPAAQSLPMEVDEKIRALEGVKDVYVNVTWNPPWDRSMMSEAAQLELGML